MEKKIRALEKELTGDTSGGNTKSSSFVAGPRKTARLQQQVPHADALDGQELNLELNLSLEAGTGVKPSLEDAPPRSFLGKRIKRVEAIAPETAEDVSPLSFDAS